MTTSESAAEPDQAAVPNGSSRRRKPATSPSADVISDELASSVQATQDAWVRIEVEFGLLTSSQVAEVLGAKPSNRMLASRKHAAHLIAGLIRRNAVLYPGFQFDRVHGTILPLMARLIGLAVANGWTEHDLLLWLCGPTTSFEEEDRPVDHFHDPDSVIAAATNEFETQW
ncbi:hypothetical protein [Cryobacterium roopkundense]|uniref:Uncharacterized protein n=1 Tax=Cryobacterium roopkundense TaxID=1001240 RepID=A0A7W8ZUG3_9MICO|nr:hypothetical protein [Cryobacterium roopkundense]MBB5640428.1 hypothetical protein [Cryobacterium roopkundense]